MKYLLYIFLLSLSLFAYAQDLPYEAYLNKNGVNKDAFTSGKVFSFYSVAELNSEAVNTYNKGKQLYEAGKYKKARKYLVEFVDSEIHGINMKWNGYPYNPYRVYKYHACQMLKEIYSALGNHKRAYFYYNKGIKKYWYGIRSRITVNNETE